MAKDETSVPEASEPQPEASKPKGYDQGTGEFVA